jgi:tetratricopeptide (TPR) repeat protein
LAAASLGEEARVDLKLGKLEEALDLYVQQYPTGDPTAASSLRIVSSKAVNTADDETLSRLAGNPVIQPVITAYLISSHLLESESQVETNVTQRWLAAVESADVRDVASAEKLALAAYQAGDWEGAQRWINRARATPVAQWLQAKLFLRAGKTDAAAGLLAKVAAQFPPDQPPTNPPAQLFDNLSLAGWTYTQHSVHAAAQVSGELGVFHLARRDYTEALDVLMRAGFWEDAAYIAEQVLTADELKNYVARNWADSKDVNTNADDPGAWWAVRDLRVEIRGLLARRLARLNRPAEAREFFGPELQKDYDALVQGMAKGADVSLSVGERAEAWFAAAKMTRAEGMDLFGTELDPDGHLFGGSFDLGVAVSNRTNESTTLLRASEDELRRASAPPADPNERYHYRFVAAAMGWQAALLMPDNSDATARVLCESGSWIKYLDPNRADVFYKSLVRRCRKTAIGDQADKMRWFPVLDADGKPIPWTPQPKMEVPVIDVPDVESLGNETE